MFNYHLYLYDENFDFLNGKIPGIIETAFGDQMDRAREILKNRNLAEIHYGLDSLDWMLKKGSELLIKHSSRVANEKGHCVVSRVKALILLSEEIDISNQTQFPNATWADYFAILTLAYVGEVLHSGNTGVQNLDDFVFKGQYPYMLDWPIECMEAICTAECYKKIENLTPNKNEVMAKRGKRGGAIRAEKFNQLNIKIIKLYIEKHQNSPSNRAAATRIYEELKDDVNATLTTGDPEERIAKWIGNYKNGKFTIPN